MRHPALFVLVFAAAISGCATAPSSDPAGPTGPARASLEVVNRTPDGVRVDLDGWELGRVPSGQRARFSELVPGTREARAISADGTVQRRAVDLERGHAVIWQVLPADESAALPDPPRFGRMRVVNRGTQDLEVSRDEQSFRVLRAEQDVRFADVPAGTHSLRFTAPNSHWQTTRAVEVEPDTESVVEIAAEGGEIRVANTTGESVLVRVDGHARGRVADGATENLGTLVVGVHHLTAIGEATRRENHRVVRVEADQPIEWDLSAAQGRFRVRNFTNRSVRLTWDDAPEVRLVSGEEHEYSDIALGLRTVRAKAEDGATWTTEIPIQSGQTATWTLRSSRGSLRVENRLPEAIEIRAADRVLGSVAPGAVAFFDDLLAGATKLTALGARSHRLQRETVTVDPATSAAWLVTEPVAQLQVRNRTAETITVWADGEPLGRVGDGRSVVFTQVPPGARLLEARGDVSEETIRETLEVSTDELRVWDVQRATGEVQIVNHTGEDLLPPPALAVQHKEIPTGETRRFHFPAGHRVAHFVGRESREPYHRNITVSPAKPVEWTILPLQGVLHLFNRTGETQRVLMDGRPLAVVEAGRDLQATLRAGTHRLAAVGITSGDAIEGAVRVRSRSTHSWEITPRLGHLRVNNRAGERLELRVDGGLLGAIEKDEARTYGPWPVREALLQAIAPNSGARYEVRIQLAAGRVEVWDVQQARATLLVDNQRDESVRVLLGGSEIGVVEAATAARLTVPVGRHLVELIGAHSLATFRSRLKVRAERAYTLLVPPGPATLVVVNRLPIPLTLHVAERVIGTAAANAETRLPLADIGVFSVIASPPDDGPGWHRRIDARTDRIIRWEIAPSEKP